MSVIFLKFLVALIFFLAMVAAYLALEKRSNIFGRLSPWRVLVFAIGLRLFVFCLAFMILGLPYGSDMFPYRYTFALSVSQGNLPYQGVDSEFGPLFPYLFVPAIQDSYDASALGIALIITILDCLAFASVWNLIRNTMPSTVCIRWSILYALCPLPYISSVMNNQDETWVLGIYAIVIVCLIGTRASAQVRAILAGIILAIGGLFTKSSTALPLGLILGFTRFPQMFLVGMLFVGLSSLPLLLPIFPDMITSLSTVTWPDNPSIWYLPQILTGDIHWLDNNNATLMAVVGILTILTGLLMGLYGRSVNIWRASVRHQVEYFMYSWVIVWMVFSLTTPKGISDYSLFWMAAALFLPAIDGSNRLVVLIGILCVILGPHSSISYRLMPPQRYTDLTNINQLFVLVLDLTILSTYVFLLIYTVRRVKDRFGQRRVMETAMAMVTPTD